MLVLTDPLLDQLGACVKYNLEYKNHFRLLKQKKKRKDHIASPPLKESKDYKYIYKFKFK